MPILFHVDEFVKQQSIRERLVRDYNTQNVIAAIADWSGRLLKPKLLNIG